MAIPVEQFPILSPEQAQPGLTGALRGSQLAQSILQNIYTPQREQAAAALKGAQAQMYGQQAKFMPLKMALQAQQMQQTGSRFGSAYQAARFIQSLNPAIRAQFIATHQPQVETTINQLINASSQPASPLQKTVSGMLSQYFPQSQSMVQPSAPTTPLPSPKETQQKLDAVFDTASKTPQGQQIEHNLSVQKTGTTTPTVAGTQLHPILTNTNFSIPVPDMNLAQVEKNTLGSQMVTNNKLVPLITQTRAQGGLILENFLSKNRPYVEKIVNDAVEYAGAKGRGKRYFDEWLNKNQDKLSSWDAYRNGLLPILAQAQSVMEKAGATDMQRKSYEAIYHQANNIMSNPERARMSLNKGFALWQDLGRSNIAIAEPRFPGTMQKLYGFKFYKGDYIRTPRQAVAGAQTGMVRMRADGKLYNIPQKSVAEALRRGFVRTGG
jgi:hypothetical protein